MRRLGSALFLVGSLCLLLAGGARADWTGYHFDNSHTGTDPSALSSSSEHIAWTSPTLIGTVFAEPLYYNGVVYVATMQDYVYAINPADGSVFWSRKLADPYPQSKLPCGGGVPFYGVMGTPVIDPATATLYAAAMVSSGVYELFAVNLNTHLDRFAPVTIQTPTGSFKPAIQNQRASLTLYGGHVLVPFGGRNGDCGDYHGWVFRVNASDGGGLAFYQTPASGAGMWGRGGGVISPDGYYTVATGNGVGSADGCPGNGTTYRGVNGVLRINPTNMSLFDYWAPADWSDLSCNDTDIGSTGPSVVGSGYLFQSGKNGQGYLINATNPGGQGTEVGVTGGISICPGQSFGGNAYDAASGDVFVPCGGSLYAYHQTGTALSALWNTGIDAGAPIVTGNLVWAIDRGGSGMHAYNKSDGTEVFSDGTLGQVPDGMVSPAFGGGIVLAAGGGSSPKIRAYSIGGWSASYDLAGVPSNWIAGQSQNFDVTVTNTGDAAWLHLTSRPVELNLHFATSPGGAANFANWVSNQTFPLPSDVPPAGSLTLSVTVTSPLSGQEVLEAEMFKMNDFWFNQFNSLPVMVAAISWSAGYNLTGAPASWVAGVPQTFNVILTNTGNVSWPHATAKPVELNLHFAASTGGAANFVNWYTNETLALPADLAPRASLTVSVTVTSPRVGSQVLEAEMFKKNDFWFAQFASVSPGVAAPTWSASFALSGAPAAMVAGVSQTFSVTVTNTGNITWPHGTAKQVELNLHFATSAGGVSNYANWVSNQTFPLSADVAPAGSLAVTVTVSSPEVGNEVLEAEMFKLNDFWFTQFASTPATVAAPTWSAGFNVSAAPTTWVSGFSQSFNVAVTNNGNVAWPHGTAKPVELNLHFAKSPGGAANYTNWVSNQTFALPSDVAPGASLSVNVTVSSPVSGNEVLEAEMFKLNDFWFTQFASVPVTVT